MNQLVVAIFVVLAADSVAFAQPLPRELSALVAKAGLQGPVVGWCRARVRAGESGGYAVAVASPGDGGRYVVLQPAGATFELATFKRKPDLSCYSPAEASELNLSIARSDTIQGRVTPRWTTTVVCGFLDDTTSVCWQYSPVDSRFVEVGGWIT